MLRCLALGESACRGALASPGATPRPAATNPNASWLNLTPSPLPSSYLDARSGASMVYDPIDHEVLMFGGSGSPDTWAWNHGTWQPLIPASACTPSTCPSARSYAGFAWDGADQEAVLFGGLGGSGPLGDTWALAAGTWTNLTASVGAAPAPRWEASMTFDSGDNQVLLFGGATANGTPYGDTWSFVGGRWTNLTASLTRAPDARWGAAIGNSPLGYVLLFGGLGPTSLIQNNYPVNGGPYLAWWFHDGAWTPQYTPIAPYAPVGLSGSGDTHGPCGRYDAALGWSPGNNRFVLFGGFGVIGNGTSCQTGGIFLYPLNDTWVYTGPLGGNFSMGYLGGWYNDTHADAPTPRGSTAYAADYADNYLLVFGGNLGLLGGYVSLNETWRYFEHVAVQFSGPTSIEIGAIGFTDFFLAGYGGSGDLVYTSATVRLLNSRTLVGCPGLMEVLPQPIPANEVIGCSPDSSSYNEYRTTVTVWDAQNSSDAASAGWTFTVSPPETLRVYSQYSGYFYSGFHLPNIFGVYAEIDNQAVTTVSATIAGQPVGFGVANASGLWWNSTSGVDMGSINPGSTLEVTASIADWNETGTLPVKIIQTPDWLQQFTELAQVVQTVKTSGSGPFGLKYTLQQDIPLPIGKLFNFSVPIPFISGNYSIVPDIHLTFAENSSGGVTLAGTFSFSTSKISFGVADLKLTLSLKVSGSFTLKDEGNGASSIVWQSASLVIKLAGDFSISIPIYGFSFDLFGNTIKVGFNLDIDIDPSFAVTVFMVPTTDPAQQMISGIDLMVSDVWGEFSLPIDADLSFSIAIASVAVGGTLGIDANFEISPGPFQIANIWINGSLYGKASFLFWSATWNVLGPGTIYHYLPSPLGPPPALAAPSATYDNGSDAVWAPSSRYYNTTGYDANVWSPTSAAGGAISNIYPAARPTAAAGYDGAYVFYTDDNVAAPVRQGLTVSGARLDGSTNSLSSVPSPRDPGYLIANPEATTLPDGSIYSIWDALPLTETLAATPANLTSVELHGASFFPSNHTWGPVHDWTKWGFAGSYRVDATGGAGRLAVLLAHTPLPGAGSLENLLTYNVSSGALVSNATVTGLATIESLRAAAGWAVVKDVGGNASLIDLATGTPVAVGFTPPAGAHRVGMEFVQGSPSVLLLRYVNQTSQELALYDPPTSATLWTLPVGLEVRDAHALVNPSTDTYDVLALTPTVLDGWSVRAGTTENLTASPSNGLHSFGLVQSGGALTAYGLASSGSSETPTETLVLLEIPAALPPVPGQPAGGTAPVTPAGPSPDYPLYLAGAAVAVAAVLAVLAILGRRGRAGGPGRAGPASPPPGAVEPPSGGSNP